METVSGTTLDRSFGQGARVKVRKLVNAAGGSGTARHIATVGPDLQVRALWPGGEPPLSVGGIFPPKAAVALLSTGEGARHLKQQRHKRWKPIDRDRSRTDRKSTMGDIA